MSNTVFVGGQGFSVAPSLQRGFRRRARRRHRARLRREASQRQERERQEQERLLKQGIEFEKAKTQAQQQVRQQTELRVRQQAPKQFLKPPGEISAFKRPTGLSGFRSDLAQTKARIKTKQQRGKRLSILGQAKLAGLASVQRLLTIADVPGSIKQIVKDPTLIKEIPESFRSGLETDIKLVKTSPTEGLAVIGTEILLLKGSSKGLKAISNLSKTKLGTKLKGVGTLGEIKTGQKVTIPTGKGKSVKLQVVDRIPVEPLKAQVSRAGKRVTAISSQADQLLGILKKQKVVRKPIANEEAFRASTKKLLKKFDEGKITKREIFQLDRAIQKEGSKGLLERTFFADPSGKIRPSRLALQEPKEAGLLDLLTGDVSFKQPKPQILLFEDIKVAKLPKNLKTIGKKIATNKQLTEREANLLLEFQLKKSGKFKPVGFVSREAEITLAPGEILQKVKKVGTVVVKGKRVPIIKTQVLKPTGTLKKLLTKFKRSKLTKLEQKKLDRLLKKKTGFDYGISSSAKSRKKFLNIKRVGKGTLLSASKRLSRRKPRLSARPSRISKLSSRKKATSRVSRPKSRPKSPRSPRKSITRRPPKSPPKRPPRSPPKRPPRSPPKVPPRTPRKAPPRLRTPKGKLRRKKQRPREGYFVEEKRAGKFVRLKTKPLSKSDALDKLAHRLDTKVSRTARIKIVKKVKSLGTIRTIERGRFKKTRKNLRNFKIRNGKRIKTPNTYIEKKGKAVINTPGEKRQLLLNRLAKARRVKKKKNKR